ncbi:MAG: hypothetical protein HY699_08800 [Deltaproteobacteria bacterium]|nr:hypothetical protein [Deltaproteobacteria bacterium]
MNAAPHRSGEAGVALITVLLLMAMMMALATAVTTAINMDTNLRGAYTRSTTGFYAAESGLNRGMGDYRNIFLSFNVPSGSDFAPHTLTIGDRTVNFQIVEVAGNPQSITIPPGQVFGGLSSIEYDYIVNSTAQSNNETEARVSAEFKVGNIPVFQFVAFYSKDLEIAPGRNMNLNGRIHTNGDLYLSADNATLAIADNYPSIPTVQVSSKGAIYRGRKRQNACDSPGTVTVDKLEDVVSPKPNDLDPQTLGCGGSSRRKVPVSELATWKGSMISQIESIAVPQPDITAQGGLYWNRADLRIVLNLNNTWTPPSTPTVASIEVQDITGAADAAKTALLRTFILDTTWNNGAGNSTTAGTRPIFYTDVPTNSGGVNGCNVTDANGTTTTKNQVAACYTPTFANAPLGSVSTAAQNNRVYGTGALMTTDNDPRRGGFYNWREGKWMYLLNVNLDDLLDWNIDQPSSNRLFDPADTSDGGILLYLTVKGPDAASSANNYGVRLFRSATLSFPNTGADPTGVTVVSDQAVYVAADYNSTNWQPAAILADSINVLSNNWFAISPGAGTNFNDRQSNLALTSRVATNTTINTAFLGGVDDTDKDAGASGYNGGLENYPRFHENWSNVTFNYLGSFVSLGNPLHVTGTWNAQSYNPPLRVWNYDSRFNNAATLPPLSPRFVYVQQVLFTEEFK